MIKAINVTKPSKILLLGASGMLGLEIAKALHREQIPFRALTSSESGLEKLAPFTLDIWVANPAKNPEQIAGITQGIETVISALGKSVSLFTNKEETFHEVDNLSNAEVLLDALKNKVSYYLYISIKAAGEDKKFEIPESQKRFEDKLAGSGIPHAILRPVGFYSGLHDLAIMAKRKVIPVIGDGLAKTNSIAPEDMAAVVLDTYAKKTTGVATIGGPQIHSRYEMAEFIQQRFGGKIVTVPETLADIGVFLPRLFEKTNLHDKLAFFKFISTTDMIGEVHGSITFRQYLASINKSDLP